ncbi:MAG: Rrf2 family transcriptional regulator [Clostridiales bacterium]|nr:Rrf2 family transcriptional regulator [Clostridiales bacterium]
MKLSTKGRYGLKAMFDLALHFGSGPVSLAHISERQDISMSYLEQLIATLRKAGLVYSIRGSQGGYELNFSPSEITVGDILEVLEGQLAPVSCVKSNDTEHCSKSGECVTRAVWQQIHDSITDVVDSITLQDMVNDYMPKTNVMINRKEY